jgi:RNA-directed DNA polymerase
LYHRFLFYKNFVALQAPLIVPEGKTDAIYLRSAIKKLTAYQPILGQFVDGEFSTTVRFIRYTPTVHEVMKLGNGTGAFGRLIRNYKRTVERFRHAPLAHPVILLIDNDDGAKPVLSAVKDVGVTITHTSKDPFYHLWANLYLVKTPEKIRADPKSCIEDLFDTKLLQTVIDGKTFDPDKDHGAEGKYGKLVFAEKVVRPNADTIDFSKFGLLLDRIVAVLRAYETRRQTLV